MPDDTPVNESDASRSEFEGQPSVIGVVLADLRTAKGLFSEMLVLSTETRGTARLPAEPLSYWLSTTDPKDNLRLEELIRKHGNLRAALQEAAGL